MRTLIPCVFILFTVAVLPGVLKAADTEGCVDLKQLPRLEGCVIQECSAKQHESFDTLDASINTVAYTCPASFDLQRVKRELDAEIRKAGYQTITEDKTDPINPTGTARKGSRWLRWGASAEDGDASYSLISAESSTEKFKAEACERPPAFSPLKVCEVVECASKAEDSVAMRTSLKEQTSLTGNVQTLTLACPSITVAQAFSTVEGELRASGFEILFSDREHPENAWMTGRAGNRWVELVSAQDGESVSYALTVVPSAEVLTAVKLEPQPEPVSVAVATPEPSVPIAAQPAPANVPAPATIPAPAVINAQVIDTTPATQQGGNGFVAPRPILQVPIEATHDLIYSVSGEVVVNMLVDVGENGAVTKAELTGHITKDVLKLEKAALDAVWRWRFEPARQDGRAVPAAKIAVQMHFHGRPWRF
jgi:TonB family protein